MHYHHNDQGWIISFRWLKDIKNSVINNNIKQFNKFIFEEKEVKDRNLFYLQGDSSSLKRFNDLVAKGLSKFY